MKRLLFMIATIGLLASCSDDLTESNELAKDASFSSAKLASMAPAHRSCQSMDVLERQMMDNPGLAIKMEKIEEHTRRVKQNMSTMKPGKGNGGGKPGGGGGGGGDPVFNDAVTIPVIVHVIYSNNNENISDAQINSQIDVLTEDFTASNSDINNVPSEFAGDVADANISFVLDRVTRKASSRTSWGTNDDMKFASRGGVDVIDPSTYLNIWVCNIGGGILGYAQFPGGSSATDGVVVGPNFFGRTGFLSAPFDDGRTTTHEVGHWLNLRHIWGDGRCNRDDFVDDTPRADRPNYGCPGYPTVHCRSNDMTMNYMDYVDDNCMFMFSNGQNDRMRALFAAGGARESLVN